MGPHSTYLPSPSRRALGHVLSVLIVGWLAATTMGAEFGQTNRLALRWAAPNPRTVARYHMLELTLDLRATYANPFDPDEIEVEARFRAPDGKIATVAGFLDQPFTRQLEGRPEGLVPAGRPIWRVRFTPGIIGSWRCEVSARDRTGTVRLPGLRFKVTPSSAPGFIRRSARNPRLFACDDGHPFFAVGENMCWAGNRGLPDYEEWLSALGQAGGNWIRVWMSSWNCALEWSRDSKGDWRNGTYYGVGTYSLANAWKLDRLFDLAETNHISFMLCLGTYGEFTDGGFFNEGQWKANPYNLANGGPCAQPEEFWTNPRARKLYQRRLRYLTARYGSRTSLQAWEFWNEAKAPVAWVGEMARYLKGTGEFAGQPADPYGHLVSTTYGNPAVWRLPEIDFTQTHSYGTGNLADHGVVAHQDALAHETFSKPHLLAEFGIDWRASDGKYDGDHKGLNLLNALWASALSGDAGGAMTWWWDNYIHPGKLYSDFAALRKFTDAIPWTEGEWKPMSVEVSGVQLYAIGNGRGAAFWAHNPPHNWKALFEKQTVSPAAPTEAVIPGLPAGRYTLEWWDTWKGEVTRREVALSQDGQLKVPLPELLTDLAVRIEPAPKP